MKILHFLIGDSFAVRFLSVFTNTTINEHHAIEFDWSNGEENIMDISKLGSKTPNSKRLEVEFFDFDLFHRSYSTKLEYSRKAYPILF